jgi:hypothetical protein
MRRRAVRLWGKTPRKAAGDEVPIPSLRGRDGETLLTDGPAAEIKEVFGGFTLVECAGLDDALKWAARLPAARDGRVEVRPIFQVPG